MYRKKAIAMFALYYCAWKMMCMHTFLLKIIYGWYILQLYINDPTLIHNLDLGADISYTRFPCGI